MTPEEFKKLIEDSGLEDESFILMIFDEFGSVKKNMAINTIMPEQILAAASELEVIGKNMIMQRENARLAEQMNTPRIEVPKIQVK